MKLTVLVLARTFSPLPSIQIYMHCVVSPGTGRLMYLQQTQTTSVSWDETTEEVRRTHLIKMKFDIERPNIVAS